MKDREQIERTVRQRLRAEQALAAAKRRRASARKVLEDAEASVVDPVVAADAKRLWLAAKRRFERIEAALKIRERREWTLTQAEQVGETVGDHPVHGAIAAAAQQIVEGRIGPDAPQAHTVAALQAEPVILAEVAEDGSEQDVYALKVQTGSVLEGLLEAGEIDAACVDAACSFVRLGNRVYSALQMRKMATNDVRLGTPEDWDKADIDAKAEWDAIEAFLRPHEFSVLNRVLRHGEGLASVGGVICTRKDRNRKAERAVSYLVSGLDALADHLGMRPKAAVNDGG